MRAFRAVGRRDQLGEMRLVGAGDEALRAVDDVVIALAHRGRAHAAGIAAGIGLGLGQAPVQLAPDGRQQVLLLLLFVEMIEDRADVGAEHVDAARGQRDGAAKLGPHRDLGDQPHAEPAVFLRHVIAGQPQLLGLGGEMRANLRLELVVFARGPLDRDQLAIHEFADGVLEHPDFFRKLEVQPFCGRQRVHSVQLLCLARHHSNVDGAHAFIFGKHDQGIDLQVGQPWPVIEEQAGQSGHGAHNSVECRAPAGRGIRRAAARRAVRTACRARSLRRSAGGGWRHPSSPRPPRRRARPA